MFVALCGGCAPVNQSASTPPEFAGNNAGSATTAPPSTAAQPTQSVAIPFSDLGMTVTIPDGWRVAGNAELQKNLERLDSSKNPGVEKMKHDFASPQNGPLLTLFKAKGKGPEDRITVLVQVMENVDPAGNLVQELAGTRKTLERTFKRVSIIEDAHAIEVAGERGAERTEEHDVIRKDGNPERLGVTMRFFRRRTRGVALSVSWIAREDHKRPEEATRMLDVLSFSSMP